MVLLPGEAGQMGVMRNHVPLMTTLIPGEIILFRNGEEDEILAVSGGLAEVRPDTVTILADTAERGGRDRCGPGPGRPGSGGTKPGRKTGRRDAFPRSRGSVAPQSCAPARGPTAPTAHPTRGSANELIFTSYIDPCGRNARVFWRLCWGQIWNLKFPVLLHFVASLATAQTRPRLLRVTRCHGFPANHGLNSQQYKLNKQ